MNNKYINIINIIENIIKENIIGDYIEIFRSNIQKEFNTDLVFSIEDYIQIFDDFSLKYSKNAFFAKEWFDYCINTDLNYINNFLKDFDIKNRQYVCIFLFRYLYCVPYIAFLKKENISESYYNNLIFTTEELKEQKEYHETQQSKFSIYKCAGNIDITAGYYQHGLPNLPEKIKKYIKYKDFFDIGAYTGDSMLVLKDFSPSRIYSFEPDSYLYNTLLQTIKMNSLNKKTIPINIGLSDIDGIKILGMSSFGMVCDPIMAEKIFKTRSVKLDSFVFNKGCNPGLLKLDVEGSEYSIIVGGSEKIIKKYKPVLLISVYHRPQDFFEIKEHIVKWKLNYEFKMEQYNCWRPNIETVLVCYPKL